MAANQLSEQKKEEIWLDIASQTSASQQVKSARPARILSFSNIYTRYAMAAVLLVTAMAALFLVQYLQQDTLLAESGASITQVSLAAGGDVQLRPNTQLFKVSGDESAITYRLEGEAFFSIEKNPARQVNIVAGAGHVTVTGTQFTVSNWGGFTEVYLENGSVRFTSLATEESVSLEPGQVSRITADSILEQPEPAASPSYKDWLNNQIIFEQKPAGYIFSEIEHHFNITITAPQDILEDSLTGRIILETPEKSLQELERVLPGRFELEEDATYRYIPNDSR